MNTESKERSLADILKEIVETTKVANVCLDDIPWSTRTAWGSNIGEARENLKKLRAEYQNKLLTSTLAIFVSGDRVKATQFAGLAESEGDTITLNAEELYGRLAQGVEPALGTERVFTASLLPIVIRGIKEVANELDIKEIESPKMAVTPILRNFDEVVDYMRELVRGCCGDSLNRLYLGMKLVNQAIENQYDSSVVPVVVLNATPTEMLGISGMFATVGAQVRLNSAEEVTADVVLKAFRQAKQKNKTAKADKADKVETQGE